MKTRSLALLAGTGAVLMLGGQASARYLGITTESKPNEYGILTISVYAEFDNPYPGADAMQVVVGTQNNPLIIQVEGGTFYNHMYGDGQATAPDADLVVDFPSLAFDTFITIGVKSVGPGGQPVDATIVTPGFPGLTGSQIATSESGWAVTPLAPQGYAFDPVCFPGDGRVLIGQFSTHDGSAIHGIMLLQFRSDGVVEQAVVSFGGAVTLQSFV
ncbi:MAG: hypothetical protein E2O40_01160, partial [Planctomycetota bacterium]